MRVVGLMDIGIIGVNYKSADLSFRERLIKNLKKAPFNQFLHPFSSVVLNTCNRFEVYFHSPSLTQTHSYLLHDFTQEFNQNSRYKLYSFFGSDCFEHLAKVTSGLDSAIFAETEIQGQVKNAYKEAQERGTCSKELHFLFQKSLKIGKEMRLKLPTRQNMPDLVQTIIYLKENLKQISEKPKILFVGASKINQQIIKRMNLKEYQIYLTNRSEKKGREIAEKLKVEYFSWKFLSKWGYFNGVVLATNSYEYLIESKDEFEDTSKLILDLSVPRNADPKLALDPKIKLLNIDQINKMVRKHRQIYLQKTEEIESAIKLLVKRQTQIFQSKNQYIERTKAVI